MEIIILASGSKGNAAYIKTKSTTLLIDAGISFRQLKLRLESHNIELDRIDGVLLTHEHSDHTKGLFQLVKQIHTPIYTTKKTYRKIKHTLPIVHETLPIEADVPFMLQDLIITPISTSHDAVDSLGFVIQEDDKRLVYITDTGYIDEQVFHKISNAEGYVLESNYDVALLFDSTRPHYLKKRIDSIKGHLSNDDAAYYLTRLIGDRTKNIVLAHPSEECNTEKHARDTLSDIFNAYELSLDHCEVTVAKQHQPTHIIKI